MRRTALPGIGGNLFAGRYLVEALSRDLPGIDSEYLRRQSTQLAKWWMRTAETCGPAVAVRAIFDRVAMPLFDGLGFRTLDARFDVGSAHVVLATSRGTSVSLIVLPWARSPSGVWRDASAAAKRARAQWCIVFAPPFLSLIPARADCLRRTIEFTFPDILQAESAAAFLRLMRASAFDPSDDGRTPLDSMVAGSASFQDRVRQDLQDGVFQALRILMPALPRIARRRDHAPFDEALTLLYRILFLLFAESRELVPCRHPIYRETYSLSTLCVNALDARDPRGLWEALGAISRLSRAGCRIQGLTVTAFNGALFSRRAAPSLERRHQGRRYSTATRALDHAVQRTLTALATRPTRSGREQICYADLGVEQLGAVYERVLDLDARTLQDDRRPPVRQHSARRKESGTFYTPQDLAEFVVRRTLAPLVAGRSSDAILRLRVCDPAMGSGAFLVAACRYLAAAYERALVEEGRCGETDLDAASRAGIRRLVAQQCLAGVDENPVAVQLARLSLWLATLAEGKPLGFLDHRLRVGHSLVGADPRDLRRIADRPSRHNIAMPLFDAADAERPIAQLTSGVSLLVNTPDETVAAVHAKEARWLQLTGAGSPIARWHQALDLWCARWFWPDTSTAPSAAELRAAIDVLLNKDATLRPSTFLGWIQIARQISERMRVFHWPLEFPDVFYDDAGRLSEQPGFDAVIGNPPWEMLRQDAGAPQSDEQRATRRATRQLVRFIRDSGIYQSCDRGHVNLYQPFLERSLALARSSGRIGLVLPWGLAVDDGATALRNRLFERASVDTIVGFDNGRGLFPIHRGLRFLVLVAGASGRTQEFRARFGVYARADIAALPAADELNNDSAYPIRLRSALIGQLSSAWRVPDVRRPCDLRILERLTNDYPALGSDRGWRTRFGRELNCTEDRSHFGSTGLPVLEGKHIEPFFADTAAARFRIEESAARTLLPPASFNRPRVGYRDVSGVANRLSLIAAVIPAGVVTTHTLLCARTAMDEDQQHFLCGVFNSYVLNAIVRMLMGGHVTTSLVESLPVPVWTGDRAQLRIARLARRLSQDPHRKETRARIQALVAALYRFEHATYAELLTGFPLVEQAEKMLALDYLKRLALTSCISSIPASVPRSVPLR